MLMSLCEVCGGGCEGRLAHLLAWAPCLKTGAGSSSMGWGGGGGVRCQRKGQMPGPSGSQRGPDTAVWLGSHSGGDKGQEEEDGAESYPRNCPRPSGQPCKAAGVTATGCNSQVWGCPSHHRPGTLSKGSLALSTNYQAMGSISNP